MMKAVDDLCGRAAELGAMLRRDHPDMWAMEKVPDAAWRAIAEAGLFGLSTPQSFGGAGLAVEEIARISRAFIRAAGFQGLATVWQSHNLMADWILGHFADADQQAAWFPKIATGSATLAFAVSEPGAGAHPKRLSSRAERVGDGWRISGRKAYVTNGPIADVFAIVAVVDEDADGRKRFGAFLVPATADGLKVEPSEHVDFLKPSGHASLALDQVFAPAAARLTDAADVYPLIVRPLRDHEDAAGAWSRLGGFERLAVALAGREGLAAPAGAIMARLRAVELLLEKDATDEGLLSARAILDDVRREVAAALEAEPDALGPADAALARDLEKLGGVARYAVEARFEAYGRKLGDCA